MALPASMVSQLKVIGQQVGIDTLVLQELERVLTDQEQPILTLALVGAHGHGKSTLANALIGQRLLPINSPFEQTTVYRLSHSDVSRAQLISIGPEAPESAQVEQIASLLQRKAQLTGRSVAASIKEVKIDHPVPDLKKGVVLLDTPGLGSESIVNQLTLDCLTQADIVLYVLMPDQTFRDYLARQLSQVLEQDNVRLFFVMTGMDRLTNVEMRDNFVRVAIDHVQQVVRQVAAQRFGVGTQEYAAFVQQMKPTSLFLLSGYYGLEAKLSQNSDLLAQSGLSFLEDQIEVWLAEKQLLRSQQRQETSRQIFRQVHQTISAHLRKQIDHLEHEQIRLKEGVQQLQSLVYALQQMSEIEVNYIDAAATHAATVLSQRLTELNEILEKDAFEFIRQLTLLPSDLAGPRYQITWLRVLFRLSSLWRDTTSQFAHRLQVDILQSVSEEMNRIHGFATTVDQLMGYAEQRLHQMGVAGLTGQDWAAFVNESNVHHEQDDVSDDREKNRFAYPVSRWMNLLRTARQNNVPINPGVEIADNGLATLRQRFANTTPTVRMFGHKWLDYCEVAENYASNQTINNPGIAYQAGLLSSILGCIKLDRSLLQLTPPESPPTNSSAYKQSLRMAVRDCLNHELLNNESTRKPFFDHLVQQSFSTLQLDVLNVAEKAQYWLNQLRNEDFYQEQLHSFGNLEEQLTRLSP